MTVYVDEMLPCQPNAHWPYPQACHLVADSLEELHEFAVGVLSLRRGWFQKHPRMPHYDLVASKRALAVLRGACEVDRKTVVSMMQNSDKRGLPNDNQRATIGETNACRLICHTCNKTKVRKWVNMKRRWPRCCGRQMDLNGVATKADDVG